MANTYSRAQANICNTCFYEEEYSEVVERFLGVIRGDNMVMSTPCFCRIEVLTNQLCQVLALRINDLFHWLAIYRLESIQYFIG